MMLQPLRSPDRLDKAERLHETIRRPDGDLDELAREATRVYQFGRISIRPDAALLYPSAGYFPLFARRTDGHYEPAIAIPIGGRHAFVAVPRAIEWHMATQHWARYGRECVGRAQPQSRPAPGASGKQQRRTDRVDASRNAGDARRVRQAVRSVERDAQAPGRNVLDVSRTGAKFGGAACRDVRWRGHRSTAVRNEATGRVPAAIVAAQVTGETHQYSLRRLLFQGKATHYGGPSS
jgi:hypothetical protein